MRETADATAPRGLTTFGELPETDSSRPATKNGTPHWQMLGVSIHQNGCYSVLPDSTDSAERLTAERVCRVYTPRIYHLALRMMGNEADAEDVTQEVLLQVVRKLDTFRGESSISTWLHRVTTNAALALRRKRATCRERQIHNELDIRETDDALGPTTRRTAGPEEQAQGRELSQLIAEATASLPDIYREVFVMADVEELPNAKIGVALGLSLPAVKSRLHRARRLLRDALAPLLAPVETQKS